MLGGSWCCTLYGFFVMYIPCKLAPHYQSVLAPGPSIAILVVPAAQRHRCKGGRRTNHRALAAHHQRPEVVLAGLAQPYISHSWLGGFTPHPQLGHLSNPAPFTVVLMPRG